ncbi:MAG: hypothetical protein IKW35_04430 [Paludibacteraceae bacterium]|nr:hypothetical protein [Paludibacteraceae bacterium]
MGIFGRFRNYKDKKKAEQETLQQPVTEAPAEELSITDMTAPSPQDKADKSPQAPIQTGELTAAAQAPDLSIKQDNTPAWVNAGSYEELVKTNPNVSRGQYAYELSKYRRSQGQPDLSYAEWSNIIKGQDPYETEADRQKRERRMKTAKILTGVGSVLGNLVNYVRAKNGHVAMNLDDGTKGYNRLERIRMGHEQLARSNAKDYLAAIAQDRAERAKQEAAAAAAKQAERNYQMKVNELEWKMNNAKTEAERKKAADELAAQKFAWQKQKDEATLKETQRHNKASEATARARVERTGTGNKKYLELKTGTGTKRYTPDEYGSNWIHKAYQDMLKEPGGKDFAVTKYGGFMGGSSVPSDQEMYEAITKYNDSLWKVQYKSSRYGGNKEEKPPLE